VNRKQWIAADILITIMVVIVVVLLQDKNSDELVDMVQDAPVSVLAYCSEEDVKPCVVASVSMQTGTCWSTFFCRNFPFLISI